LDETNGWGSEADSIGLLIGCVMSMQNHYAFVCDIGIASRRCLLVKKMNAEMMVKKMTAMIMLFN
jgi:hypothetical protein